MVVDRYSGVTAAKKLPDTIMNEERFQMTTAPAFSGSRERHPGTPEGAIGGKLARCAHVPCFRALREPNVYFIMGGDGWKDVGI